MTRIHSLLLLALCLPPSVEAQDPVPVGSEIQVNTYTTARQTNPNVAVDGSGDFVVVWNSDGSAGDDISSDSIQAQRFSSSGSLLGGELQVNSYTTGSQLRPSVVSDIEGNFVVVWESAGSSGTDTDSESIQGRRFASDGSPLGDQFQVNSYTTAAQLRPSLGMDADGNFVVTWTSSGSAGNDDNQNSIQAQRYSSSGNALGDQFQVNSYTTGLQFYPSATMNAEGNFVVAWFSIGSAGSDDDFESVQARRFDSSGSALGSEFQVNSFTTNSQRVPSVASDAEGNFVVAWYSTVSAGTDDSGYSIQARRFNSSGNALGDDFQVNSYTTEDQSYPSVASDPAGSFVVVWRSRLSVGNDDDHSVQAQRFNSSGNALGDQFQVNSYTTNRQGRDRPSAAVDAAGDFVVAWESRGSAGSDSSAYSIQAQRFRVTGDVGDRVWLDEDGDGLQGAGEPGQSGVGVDLYDDFAVLIDSTVTDVDGEYLFTKLTPGDYFLDFTLPSDFFFTLQDAGDDALDSDVDASGETATFAVAAGVADLDQDAGLVYLVGDRVWRDDNANGVQDGGEPGVEGVAVTLFDAGGVQLGQDVTDADGLYRLAAPPGDHYLRFALPADEAFTLRDVGLDDAIDSDASVDGVTIVFNVSSSDSTRDAGLVSAPTAIGDRVWLDTDLDGVQDGGEAGVPGVSVELFTFAGVSQGTTVTAADGSYSFTGLAAGSYYLAFSEPAGFCYTAQDQGGDETRDSDVDPLTLTTGEIVLNANQNDASWDAGLVPDASIGNRVWLDNGDGIQGGGEAGVEGVTVRLYDELGAQLEETATDADGHYSFAPGPGEYYLEFILPTDTAFAPRDQGSDDAVDSDVIAESGTTVPFGLGPGAVDATRDAGIEPATIGNRVWLDADGDGRQQPGEAGLAGVTVRLLDAAETEIAVTTTGTDGVYGFLGIASGEYLVEVIAPSGAVFSLQDVGGDDLIDSDVDPSTGRTELFPYSAGGASRSHDAGFAVLFVDGFETGDTSVWSAVFD